jgi:hypothetical protein
VPGDPERVRRRRRPRRAVQRREGRVDNNVTTTAGAGTEDEIYVVAASEVHVWEDPRAQVLIRAEQTFAASLGVLLVLYGFWAYSVRRYTNGHQKVAGSGLISPTF